MQSKGPEAHGVPAAELSGLCVWPLSWERAVRAAALAPAASLERSAQAFLSGVAAAISFLIVLSLNPRRDISR